MELYVVQNHQQASTESFDKALENLHTKFKVAN